MRRKPSLSGGGGAAYKMAQSPSILLHTAPSGVRCAFQTVASTSQLKRAHLRLVVRVGSLAENDDQTGAAHFIEHLGFRGTTKFDHGELISRVESFGSTFGPDLNARTSLCETVWQLDLPAERLEEGLEVIQEWAFNIRISDEDVEAERKVILEEYRQKQTAGQRTKKRFWSMAAPIVAERLPIGTKEFISSVPATTLRKFYEAAYQPDNMSVACIIESGTDERDHLASEFLLKFDAFFHQAPSRRFETTLRSYAKTLFHLRNGSTNNAQVACVVDDDLNIKAISLEFLQDYATPAPEAGFLKREVTKRVLTSALDERFREMRLKGLVPRSASVSFGVALQHPYVEMSGVRMELAPQVTAVEANDALVIFASELFRISRFGFYQEEIDHAKGKWRKHFQDAKQTSLAACEDLVEYFSLGETTPLLGFDRERNFVLDLLSTVENGITSDEVNELARDWLAPLVQFASCRAVDDPHHVMLCLFQGPSLPEGLSTTLMEDAIVMASKQVNGLDDDVAGRDRSGYDEQILRNKLREDVLAIVGAGEELDGEISIVGINKRIRRSSLALNLPLSVNPDVVDDLFGPGEDNRPLSLRIPPNFLRANLQLPFSQAEVFQFKRGSSVLRICVRRSDAKQISFQAYSMGGATDLIDPVDDVAFCLLGDALRESGLGSLTGTELNRLESLSGSRVYLQRHLMQRGIGGSCAQPGDFPTLLDMLLLRTAIFDCNEAVLERLKQRELDSITAMEVSSAADETNAIREVAFGSSEPLLVPHKVKDVKSLTVNKVEDVARRGFARLSDFTFCFVGPLGDDHMQALELLADRIFARETALNGDLVPWLKQSMVPRQMNLMFYPQSFKVIYASKTITDKSQVYLVSRPADAHSQVDGHLKDFLNGAVCELIRNRLIAKMRTATGEVYSVQTDWSRSTLSTQYRTFVSFSCDWTKDEALVETAISELKQMSLQGFSAEETSSVLTMLKQKCVRNATTDSHMLFKLLDGLRSSPDDLALADDIASQQLTLRHLQDGEVFLQSVRSILAEIVASGVSTLIVRYRPQKL